MVQSMTAFSRQSRQFSWGTMAIEMRSVNQRFLDPSFRIPESFRALEVGFRNMLRGRISRGKVEISVRFEPAAEAESLTLNQEFAQQLINVCNQLSEKSGDRAQIDTVQLMKWPGVIQTSQIEVDDITKDAEGLFGDVITAFIEHREREGQSIEQMITDRLDAIVKQVAIVKENFPEAMKWQREKITERLNEAQLNIDNERLEQELVYLANKTDVAEEIDRLETHVNEVASTLKRKEPIGRKLDFLMQELNREANTLASKSITNDITQASVEIKVLIEQMREQIQNVE